MNGRLSRRTSIKPPFLASFDQICAANEQYGNSTDAFESVVVQPINNQFTQPIAD
ncbi:MAG: hypothetical protein ACI82A_003853 [Candidatus Azotimanducaceae bacterium]|jgi:hypothetical protein